VSTYNDIVNWAKVIKAYISASGEHMYFTFNHEPEAAASNGMGTPTDYINAWRNIVNIFRAQNVTNIEYVFVGTDYGWTRKFNVVQWFYPGDSWVDDIGADSYNWADCRPEVTIAWKTLQSIIYPTTVPGDWSTKTGRPASEYGLVRFGALHPTKGLMLPEFGSVENQDGQTTPSKAQWIAQAQLLLKQPAYHQFKLINLWNFSGNGAHSTCNFKIDSSTSALQAMRVWGADAAYRG
jgi:hypothetical protein